MKLLIIGNGGREHALAWKLAQSKEITQIFVAPGNPGIALESKTQNIAISTTNLKELLSFALKNAIDITVVGPETPLCLGIVDEFQKHGLKIFGPSKAAAMLEGSKAFCKDFLMRHHIPTASYQYFTDKISADNYLERSVFPVVIKDSRLAGGKGVTVASTISEAKKAIDIIFKETSGEAIIENFLPGEECSCILMLDGQSGLLFEYSQDHKRLKDNDQGPNTGGMGTYSPLPQLSDAIKINITKKIIEPTLKGLQLDNLFYTGFLYIGLMITPQGEPYVLEFNVRLGDPETQSLMMRLETDFIVLIKSAFSQTLSQTQALWKPSPSITVVLADQHYPACAISPQQIVALPVLASPFVKIFHSATQVIEGKLYTNGGRVLSVSALGKTLTEARLNAYNVVSQVRWPGCSYRKDIGARAVAFTNGLSYSL